MHKDLICRQPLLGVGDQDRADQPLGIFRDVVPERRGEVVLAGLDHLEQLLVVFLVEWWEAAKPKSY